MRSMITDCIGKDAVPDGDVELLERANREIDSTGRLDTETERAMGRLSMRAKREGKENLRTEIMLALFEANSGLAKAAASRFCIRGERTIEDQEEIFSAASEGLWIAIQRFDGRNRVSSYAVHWIRKRMQMAYGGEASVWSRAEIAKINAGERKPPRVGSPEWKRLDLASRFLTPPSSLPTDGDEDDEDRKRAISWEDRAESAFEGENLAGETPEEAVATREILDFIAHDLDPLQRELVERTCLGTESLATVSVQMKTSRRRAKLALAEALSRIAREFGLESRSMKNR